MSYYGRGLECAQAQGPHSLCCPWLPAGLWPPRWTLSPGGGVGWALAEGASGGEVMECGILRRGLGAALEARGLSRKEEGQRIRGRGNPPSSSVLGGQPGRRVTLHAGQLLHPRLGPQRTPSNWGQAWRAGQCGRGVWKQRPVYLGVKMRWAVLQAPARWLGQVCRGTSVGKDARPECCQGCGCCPGEADGGVSGGQR